MSSKNLFSPWKLGRFTLPNRIIMAPLTRMRATAEGVPTELMQTYYTQRASAGLIISEATQISAEGQGYPCTPGIYTKTQIAAWKNITDAVHASGGRIFAQLWHVGRISAPCYQPNNQLPVAPSAIAPRNGFTMDKAFHPVAIPTPRALTKPEIQNIVRDYAQATRAALAAGFDGVELHAANGYLQEEFLEDSTNVRDDEYGGSIANRCRFLEETLDAILANIDADRVGIRLSPYGTANDMHDSNPIALFSHVVSRINARNLAYVHMIEPRASGAGQAEVNHSDTPSNLVLFRAKTPLVFFTSGGYTPELAREAVSEKNADGVVFGRYFISNPDLPRRIQESLPLTPYDRKTFYGGTEQGYTDYPFYN